MDCKSRNPEPTTFWLAKSTALSGQAKMAARLGGFQACHELPTLVLVLAVVVVLVVDMDVASASCCY